MANILVIDDDNDILRILESTLKRAGHTIITAINGEQGLAAARAHHPDLVVCDLMMPNMTGYEFCKQVRADPNLQHIPIIIFSARFQPIDEQTARDAGATDYLPKSTAPDILVNRIAELLPVSTQRMTPGGMIGLFSLRGGAGVTSLAVNLSIALTLTQKISVGLVDLAQQGGHTAVMLGMKPTSNVTQAIASVQKDFTGNTLNAHFMHHSSGIQLLASTPTFVQAWPPTDDGLLNLINSLRSIFAIAVLDVPHILEPHYSPILQLMDKIVLILSTDLPSLQSTAIALQGLTKLGLTDDNIELVVNQITPYHSLPVSTIQNALNRPILATIPFEADMVKAINSGKPLILSKPASAATAAIGKLAQAIFT
jgi:pilus assembly protein CpaE